MSLPYSDTTNKDGIIQVIEQKVFGDDGDGQITGNTFLFAKFNGSINRTMDRAFHLIFNSDGRWQFDDRNHADYPIITTNIVSGQRDYSFTVDGNSNLILEIQKVVIDDSSGKFFEVVPVDQQASTLHEHGFAHGHRHSRLGIIDSFWDGQNVEGKPWRYDKTANGIFLDPIPDYNATNGLKIFISREASYFTTADTTKQPGFAGLFHEYCALRPAWQYAYENGLSNANAIQADMLQMEDEIVKYYGKRQQDERPIMTHRRINYV